MKNKLLVIVVAFLSVCCINKRTAIAQSIVQDPIQNYLNLADSDTSVAIQHSKELLKLSLDINGDGKPVIFLTLPFFYEKQAGFIWTAYVPTKGGYVKAAFAKEGPNLAFFTDRIFLGSIPELGGQHALITAYISHGSGEIHAYWLKDYTLNEKVVSEFDVQQEGGSIENQPAAFQKYFPNAGKPDEKDSYPVEHISFGDLRARGYNVPLAN